MYLAVPANLKINFKEYQKKHMFLDLARESNKPWNMKLTVLPEWPEYREESALKLQWKTIRLR